MTDDRFQPGTTHRHGGAYGAGACGVGAALTGRAASARPMLARRDHPDGRGAAAALRRPVRHEYAGDRCRLVVLGDSTAAGYGVRPSRARRPARCSPPAWPSSCAGRSTCTASPWSAPSRRAARSAGGARPWNASRDVAVILIGGNDVTHRRPRDRGRAPPGRRGARGCARPAPRWSSAPAPTWARSSRSSRRCAGWPAGGAASWRPRRRSPWSRPAAGRSRSATCSGRRSRPSRTGCSAGTGSTRPRDGYAMAAAAMLPTLLAGPAGEDEPAAPSASGEGVRCLPTAAVEAVERAGTEVSGDPGRPAATAARRAAGRSCGTGCRRCTAAARDRPVGHRSAPRQRPAGTECSVNA